MEIGEQNHLAPLGRTFSICVIQFCSSAGFSSITMLSPKPDLTGSVSYFPKILKLNKFLRISNPQILIYEVAMCQKSIAALREIQYLFNVNNCTVWAVVLWKRLETARISWTNIWRLLWSINHLSKRCFWLAYL